MRTVRERAGETVVRAGELAVRAGESARHLPPSTVRCSAAAGRHTGRPGG